MAPDVIVITDSAASVPPALAQSWGLEVVAMEVRIDDVSYREDADLSAEDVAAALVAGKTVATSQPSPGAFAAAYSKALEGGAAGVVSVHLSSGVSGTVNSARLAAGQARLPVAVVDSQSLGMGTGWAALAAAAVARDGGSVTEVAREARRAAESATVIVTVENLEYLKRGGRVSPAMASLGDALGIRPVLGMRGGEVVVLRRVRTTAKAAEAVVEALDTALTSVSAPGLAVMALESSAYADGVTAALEHRHPELRMVVRAPVAAVLAVHGGPGAFAAVVADLPPALR